MSAPLATAASPAPAGLPDALIHWRHTELPRWIFVGKTLAAAFLSLWISFRLGFTAPSTSLITVFIIAQPQSGLVLAKSFYRLIGSVVGAIVALALVGTLVQQRELFVLSLAFWVGGCTAGAAYFRGFQSYAFVLSGYTAMLIGIPSVFQPEQVFDTALFRVSEILVGIISTGVITDLVLPRRVATLLVASVRRVYAEFIRFADEVFHADPATREVEDRNLRLIQDIVAFETQRSAAGFEDPQMRVRDSRLRQFNADLIQSQTSLNAFTRALARSRRQGRGIGAAFQPLTKGCVEALRPDGALPTMASEAIAPRARLVAFRDHLETAVAGVRVDLLARSPDVAIDFDIAADLFTEFVDDLVVFTTAYVALANPRNRARGDSPAFALHTDGLGALLMAVRAAVTVGLLSAFWILAAWPSGAGATLIGGVVAALFGAAPNPGAAVRRFVAGFLIGLVAAAFCDFVLLPRVNGFPMLCVVLAPFLMASAYLMTDLRTAAVGLSIMLMFGTSLSIKNEMGFDPAQLLNDGLGQLLGVAVAGIAFSVLVPARSRWGERRLNATLRRYAAEVCVVPLAGVRHRFESRLRDALTQIVAFGNGTSAELRTIIAQQLAVLDVAHAVYRLRLAALPLHGPVPSPTQRQAAMHAVRECLLRPDDQHLDRAQGEVGNLAAALEESLLAGVVDADTPAIRRMRIAALRLEAVLLDPFWFADFAAPEVRPAARTDLQQDPELPAHAP